MIGIGVCGDWCTQAFLCSGSRRLTACVVAVASGLMASVVHSLWDFVWYIPACMSLAVVLAACHCRLQQLATAASHGQPRSLVLSRGVAISVAVVVLGLGGAMVGSEIRPAC